MNKPKDYRDDYRDEAELAAQREREHLQEWADYYHTRWLETWDELTEVKDKLAQAEQRYAELVETTGRRISQEAEARQ